VCIYIIFAPTGRSSGEPFGSIRADSAPHTCQEKTRAALSLKSPSHSTLRMSSPLLGAPSAGSDLAHTTVTMPISVVMLSPGMSSLLGCVDVEGMTSVPSPVAVLCTC